MFDSEGKIADIVEKPKENVGNQAIGGIYLFDETLYRRMDELEDTSEFSISDITRQYVADDIAQIRNIGYTTWVDCGTREISYMPQSWPEMEKFHHLISKEYID